MGKIVVSEFVTLDGVFQDPGSAEGFSRGGWAFRFNRGEEGDRFKLDEFRAAGALLLGRATYEAFAAAWPSRSDEVGFAERMNNLPKYVISSTLQQGDWNNTIVLSGDIPGEVRRLKEQIEGDILVNGSGRLVQTLMAHELVDEYRLMVYPVVLGGGERLFGEGETADLRLVDTITAGECLILIYRPKR